MFEIENVLIDRPITYFENEVGFLPLKPNRILTIASLPTEKEDFTTLQNDSQFRACLHILRKNVSSIRQQFWENWTEPYLTLLRELHYIDREHFKKATHRRNPQIGEIVLIDVENFKPNNGIWPRLSTCQEDSMVKSGPLNYGCRRNIL